MTRLASLIAEQKTTYTALAEIAQLQPRTVRQLATGETPINNVAVGTVRRIAAALSVPVSVLLEEEPVYPGDGTRSRVERLSAAIRDVMWSGQPVPYRTPVEPGARDEIADLPPEDFFGDMPAIDARRS